jgi:rod shape-determining protein MreC
MRSRNWGWTPEGRQRFAILGLFLVHLIWIVLGRGPSSRLQTATEVYQRPGLRVANLLSSWRHSRQERAMDLGQVRAELARTRQQVEALQIQRSQDAQRLAEAEEAGRLLGLKKLLPLEFNVSRVVANLRKAPFGGLILDRGADGQFHPEQGVICADGVVGRIWSVGATQSSVLPLDAYNASTAVMLARSRATGILQGVGPGRAEIRYIGAQEVVQIGEPVLTSGLDRVFPRGLLVGYVSASHPLDVELRVEVALAATLDRVGLVLILPPSPQLELAPPAEPPKTAKGGKP